MPRVWEKFAEVIQAKGRANGAVMQSLGSWAKGKVGEAYKENQAGGAANWTPWGHTVANALVGKVRKTPSWRRRWSNFSLYRCIPTGMRGPTCILWANLTPFSRKARAALGLDRCTHMYTGAAPITKETLEYFGSLGIKILELYGMSENTGPMTVSDRAADSRGPWGSHRTPWHPVENPLNPLQIGKVP